MKVHTMPQGTREWFHVRLGIPTASSFEKIVTPTGKLSTQARKYAHYLAAESLLGRSLDTDMAQEWMQRGREMEPDAARMYQFEQDVETRPVGFITTDDGTIGASPDRLLVGCNGALEIKCPAPQTHVGYMVDGFGNDYRVQVQGQMLVGEFDFVDRYSYHPELPPVLVRTERDDPFIALLSDALGEFLDLRDECVEKVRKLGFVRIGGQLMPVGDAT
jgi:hypothetical protein